MSFKLILFTILYFIKIISASDDYLSYVIFTDSTPKIKLHSNLTNKTYYGEISQTEDISVLKVNSADFLNLFDTLPENPKKLQSASRKEIKDKISFGDNKILNFSYFTIDDREYFRFFPPFIGFSFKNSDKKYSFMYQLKNQSIINKMEYSFSIPNFYSEDKQSLFYIGGYPESEIENKSMASCDVLNEFEWTCQMNSIYLDNYNNFQKNYNATKHYAIHGEDLIFDIGERYILVPKNFFNYLIKEFFGDLIKDNHCKLFNNYYGKAIYCDIFYTDGFSDISFIIDGYFITIPGNHLFNFPKEPLTEEEICDFIFVENDENEFVFGMPFYKNFFTVFNYENKTVEFYSPREFYQISYKKKFPYKKNLISIIINVCIVMLAANIIFFIVKVPLLLAKAKAIVNK